MHMKNGIKYARLYHGMSQREIARNVGISSTAMSAIERGEHIPSAVTAILIARELRTTVERLWGEAADEVTRELYR